MSNKSVNVQIGPGFTGLLTIVLVIAKLTGHLSWGWLWVLSPIWIILCVWLAIVVGVLLVAAIAAVMK